MAAGQGWSAAAAGSRVAISARAARDSGLVGPATRSRPCESERAEDEGFGVIERAEDTAHDGCGGQPGADLEPGSTPVGR
jgi:hypothetical protein